MINITDFTLREIISTFNEANAEAPVPMEGFCFRSCFKYAACKLLGERFKFLDMNVRKAMVKHRAYRERTRAFEEKPHFDFSNDEAFNTYIVEDEKAAHQHLTEWGKKSKVAREKGYNIVPGKRIDGTVGSFLEQTPVRKVEAIIIAFYGRDPKRKPKGHAIVLIGGEEPRLYDPEAGEFTFIPGEDIGTSIEKYMSSYYWDYKYRTCITPLSMVKIQEQALSDEMRNGAERASERVPEKSPEPLNESHQEPTQEFKDAYESMGLRRNIAARRAAFDKYQELHAAGVMVSVQEFLKGEKAMEEAKNARRKFVCDPSPEGGFSIRRR